MTPAEAAEGRRLLEAYDAGGLQRGTGDRGWTALRNNLRMWLWSNREELVRCAELAYVPMKSERERIRDFYCNKAAREAGQPEPFPDPRLAHVLANPPAPEVTGIGDAGLLEAERLRWEPKG